MTCSAVVGGLLFTFVIYYLRISANLNFKLWDLKTVTAADFTVEVSFTKEMWDDF